MAKFLCTTADCWTSRRRSFIAVTVHWLTEDLLRKSGCLAVRRMKSIHNYSTIAKSLEEIHEEFDILNKTTACVTDSGSNFVNCFRLFGAKPVPSETIAPTDSIRYYLETEGPDEDVEENQSDSDEENGDDDDDEMEFIPISNLLRNRKKKDNILNDLETYSVPYHRRCVCHLLNLIASSDLGKISDRPFIRIFKSVKSKMTSLWNKQKRSAKASDFISETLGTLFITPNVTRWNSFFNSYARCASFVVLKPTALKHVFTHFGVDYFRPAEEEFLLEYVKILRPIAEALDVLQAYKKVSL